MASIINNSRRLNFISKNIAVFLDENDTTVSLYAYTPSGVGYLINSATLKDTFNHLSKKEEKLAEEILDKLIEIWS